MVGIRMLFALRHIKFTTTTMSEVVRTFHSTGGGSTPNTGRPGRSGGHSPFLNIEENYSSRTLKMIQLNFSCEISIDKCFCT